MMYNSCSSGQDFHPSIHVSESDFAFMTQDGERIYYSHISAMTWEESIMTFQEFSKNVVANEIMTSTEPSSRAWMPASIDVSLSLPPLVQGNSVTQQVVLV